LIFNEILFPEGQIHVRIELMHDLSHYFSHAKSEKAILSFLLFRIREFNVLPVGYPLGAEKPAPIRKEIDVLVCDIIVYNL